MSARPPELEFLLKIDKPLHDFVHSPRRPRYAIHATDAEPDLSTLYVELRFLAGRTYCCFEPDCHIPWRSTGLVTLAAQHAITLPENLTISWHCILETGAYNQTYHGVESKAAEFDFVSGGNKNAPPPLPPHAPMPPNFTGVWSTPCYGGRTETEYVNGVQDGFRRRWHNGVCVHETFRKNGLMHGPLITRSADGTILDIAHFDHGTGTYRIFDARHQLTDEIPMRHGKPHGPAKTWAHGKLVLTRHYTDGQTDAVNFEGSAKLANR